MHSSNMIYQAAKAHQTDLRRTAGGRSLKADRNDGQPSRIRVFWFNRTQRARASAQQPQVRMRSISA